MQIEYKEKYVGDIKCQVRISSMDVLSIDMESIFHIEAGVENAMVVACKQIRWYLYTNVYLWRLQQCYTIGINKLQISYDARWKVCVKELAKTKRNNES